jgi:hypothetical protein
MNSERTTNLDKFLDDALKNYSQAEPRFGFESRILANVRTTRVRPPQQMRLVYASAAIVTLCAALYGISRIAFSLAGTPTQPTPSIVASRMPAPDVSRTLQHSGVPVPTRSHVLKQVRTRTIRTQRQPAMLGSQLPAPAPLTAQEKLLLALVRESPKEVLSTAAWQEQMRQRPKNPDLPDEGEQQ